MKKAERTKMFIIEKCSDLFNKKGFAGTSLSDITRITGLTKGSIYGNFENKDELALEVFQYNLEKQRTGLLEAIQSESNSKDKLKAYVDFMKKSAPNIINRGGCAILNTATDSDDNHTALLREVRRALDEWKRSLIKILETGVAENEFIAGLDCEKTANFFISLTEGSMMYAKALEKKDIMNENLNYLYREIDLISK